MLSEDKRQELFAGLKSLAIGESFLVLKTLKIMGASGQEEMKLEPSFTVTLYAGYDEGPPG